MSAPAQAVRVPTTPLPSSAPSPAELPPTRRVVAWFTGTLAVLTAAVMVPLLASGADADTLNALVPVLSWAPALAALVAHLATGRRMTFLRWTAVRPLRTGRVLRTSLLMLAVFVAVPATTTAVSVALGLVQWQPGADTLRLAALVLPLALVGMLTTTGEEIGWRGALQTTLGRLGLLRASLLIGLLWSLWHLPLTLGYTLDGSLTGREVVATSVNLVVVGVVLGAARALASSVWPATWAHALMNTTMVFASSNLVTRPSGDGAFWATQAVTWTVLALAGAALVRAAVRRTAAGS